MRTLGLQESWREAEAWHRVVGSESLKRDQEGLLVKGQLSCKGNPRMLEMPRLWDVCQGKGI